MNTVQQAPAAIGHLLEVVETHGTLVADPLQWHTRDVGAQYVMLKAEHDDNPLSAPGGLFIQARLRQFIPQMPGMAQLLPRKHDA